MTLLPFRTNETLLTESDLIILDVLFNTSCELRFLRDSVFKKQWNLSYSHNLGDVALEDTIASLCQRGILVSEIDSDRTLYKLTVGGGDLWSAERCPVWERYCTERYKTTIRQRTMMTVIAVSASVRDEFLDYFPMYTARRKASTISDFGLVPWHTFGTLYIGVATYSEPRRISMDEIDDYFERCKNQITILNANRSCWRMVSELQRFIESDSRTD